jgi:Fe2+ or Zn2+ uptake regulation protein
MTAMRPIEDLVESTRQRGGKVTSQRILIWRALAGDPTHPTAEDLFERLKPQLPGLSLATLYNTLNELVEWGELRRFDTGDGHTHFDPDMSPHAEIVCLRCHSVMDLPGHTSSAPLPGSIEGYQIVTCSEQYLGICPACQQRALADRSPVSQPTA